MSSSSSSSSSDFVLDSFSYGKSLVRVLRVVRSGSQQSVIEYTVQTLLSGARLDTSYTQGDNSLVVATDSQKNTVHYLAKTLPGDVVLCPEAFALHIANHFPAKYDHITSCTVDVVAHKWSRIALQDGSPHPHSFVRDGEEKRVVFARAERQGQGQGQGQAKDDVVCTELRGGLKELLVLKSSGSAFHSFLRDEFTTLKEVQDRIFSTSVDCQYTFSLPSAPLASLLSSKPPSPLPDFEAIASSVRAHTLETFATHASASVQATLYLMCTNILSDGVNTPHVQSVEYALPNKHYVPINLEWAGLKNTSEDDAEVFLPQADPSGLIKAQVSRGEGKAQ